MVPKFFFPELLRESLVELAPFYLPTVVVRSIRPLLDGSDLAVAKKNKVLFIHIPKAAGTTVCMSLYGKTREHHTALWYKKTDPILFSSLFKFAIIRDPVDRFVSAYHFLRMGGTDIVRVNRRAYGWAQRFPTIQSFIEAVDSGREENFRSMDYVLHPQSRFVVDENGGYIVDRIYRLEEISGKMISGPSFTVDMSVVLNSSKRNGDSYVTEDVVNFVNKYYDKDVHMYQNLPEHISSP